MKKHLLLLACSILFSLLLLEVGIGLGTTAGFLRIKVPSYSPDQARGYFVSDMNPDFGVWHYPNVVTRHIMTCFDVTYRSNSHGARDSERALRSQQRRIVVLGDSLIEGFGVADRSRLTNVLEHDTGIEHLNFGTSGDFGTTQMYLLYKTLASNFSHSAVIIGMVPANDFWDNDYEFGKQAYPDRYRPYLVGGYPNYRLVYYQSSLEQSTFGERADWLRFSKKIFSEFTYSYNALAYFKRRLTTQRQPFDKSRPYSGFYDYREDQLDLVRYGFEQIRRVAGARDVVIALLPTLRDFQRYDSSTTSPLSAKLKTFAAANGMMLLDLLPEMYRHTKDWSQYFLPCNEHWNAEGHAVAAHYLRTKLAPLYRGPAE